MNYYKINDCVFGSENNQNYPYATKEEYDNFIKGYCKPLEEIKNKKLKEVKSNCEVFIYSVYPIYKQLNILNIELTNDNERKQMTEFISFYRKKCEEIENLIINSKSLEELSNLDLTFKPINR
jgi:hypothetical protein